MKKDEELIIQAYNAPQRWLVVRFGHLGDVVLTTGVLHHWGRHLGWRFDFLTREEWAGVLENHPYVDTVIGMRKQDGEAKALLPFLRELVTRYAGCGLIDLHGTLRSRILGGLWQGPVLRYPKLSVARRAFLLSKGRWGKETLCNFSVPQRYSLAAAKVVDAGKQHPQCPYAVVNIDAAFLPHSTGPALEGRVPPERTSLLPCIHLHENEREAARVQLHSLFGTVAPVALHPYAAHSYKTWPKKHWRELTQLLDAAGIPWIVVGRGVSFLGDVPHDFTNRASLRESCALLAQCRALISGDSGPMHLAGAVGTPVVGLFGPTTREWGFFPEGSRDQVLERALACRPCSLHGRSPCPSEGECLASIAPQEVFSHLPPIEQAMAQATPASCK